MDLSPIQDTVLSVTTTVAKDADARRLAQLALDRGLAACVQVEPGVVSHYRWQGQAHADPELRLTFKTHPGQWAALQAFLAEHHPYEVPQVLAQVQQASAPYAAWVRQEVSAPAGADPAPPA